MAPVEHFFAYTSGSRLTCCSSPGIMRACRGVGVQVLSPLQPMCLMLRKIGKELQKLWVLLPSLGLSHHPYASRGTHFCCSPSGSDSKHFSWKSRHMGQFHRVVTVVQYPRETLRLPHHHWHEVELSPAYLYLHQIHFMQAGALVPVTS